MPAQGYWLYFPILADPAPADGPPDPDRTNEEPVDEDSQKSGVWHTIYTPFVSRKE